MKFIVLLILAGASAYGQSASTLKDAYQRTFRIGAALNPAQFEERDARANPIVAAQFNTISPENVLKWGLVHPRADGYNFDPADHNVAFGAKHQMFIVEHCLVWHSQTPRWVFEDITELDVDVLPRTTAENTGDGSATAAGTAQSNPYQAGLPDEMQQKLATRHAELFNVFVQHRKVIGRVTFWGVTDGDSWLNNFPTRRRTNYPLLFDREGKPKPTFDAVLAAAKSK
jgi:GH35 family endo-1,4-beta-xylanase